jgi:hypothetical protein
LNPSDASVGTLSCFTSQNIESTSLYDLIETNKEMASLVVKEQLNYFQVKKLKEDECKNPLAWWRVHEV